MDRRDVLKLLGASPLLAARPREGDRLRLEEMFDKAGVDFDYDKTSITIKVNGSEVTGTEGGQVVFKFAASNRLESIVVWNAKVENETGPGI